MENGEIKVLLVAVSEYHINAVDLPLCKNDLIEMKKALTTGLKVDPMNISICGWSGIVLKQDFILAVNNISNQIKENDTFIIYFSGHGNNACFAFSDDIILYDDFLDLVKNVNSKNKIIMLDCCKSGSFNIENVPRTSLEESLDRFVGRGFAVMASSGANQNSGFDFERSMSMYTSFLCDALCNKFLIKRGKKSLEDINRDIYYRIECAKRKGIDVTQPIFRSSIVGTIYFELGDYKPYEVSRIYEETDKYIIYEVKPLHNVEAKRFAVKVIMRHRPYSMSEVAELFDEVKNKILYCDVYKNENFERIYRGSPANIIFGYFGNDEEDLKNCNFEYRAIWVDESQNKSFLEGGVEFGDIKIIENPSYELNRDLMEPQISSEEAKEMTRKCTSRMITLAEKYIALFREYKNEELKEEDLIEKGTSIGVEMTKLYLESTDYPNPPTNLRDWSQKHMELVSTIHNLSLYYNKKNVGIWDKTSRITLFENDIRQYEMVLESLRDIDSSINA